MADNLSAHKTQQVSAFLAWHPVLHSNLFVLAQSGRVVVCQDRAGCDRKGCFTSLTDLKRKLMRYIRQYNKQPKPVKWKYFDSDSSHYSLFNRYRPLGIGNELR